MKWIKCADELPKRGEFVLVKYGYEKEDDAVEMRRTLFENWETRSGMNRFISESHIWRKI